jgi:phage terminase large subunit
MGEFPETMEGRVYENVTYIDKIPDNAKRLPYGLDFGYTAPAAMVEVFYLDGGIYINEMLYESGLSNLDNLEYPEIKSLQNRLNAMNLFRNTPIVCDSAEPKSIRDLQLKGFNLVPTRKYAGSVKDMVTVVQNYPLFITKRSTNVIFEVENYVYSENLNQQGEKVPVKKNDHAMNALEYAVFSKGILW